MSDIDEEAKRDAQKVIDSLNENINLDYSQFMADIVEVFDEYLYNGVWDCTVYVDEGFKNIRLIQEDELDQHMDEDEVLEDWTYVDYLGSHYLYVEK